MANTCKLFLSAFHTNAGTGAFPLGMVRFSSKSKAVTCGGVCQITQGFLPLFTYSIFWGISPLGVKKAVSFLLLVDRAFANASLSLLLNGWALTGMPLLSIS